MVGYVDDSMGVLVGECWARVSVRLLFVGETGPRARMGVFGSGWVSRT